MPLTSGLPISRLVSVQVSLTTPAITAESVNTCLLLGTSNVIDTTERMREYTNMTDVGADFGTASEEYLGAQVWFAQNPSPTNLFIGRWVNTAAAARLNGGTLPAAVTVPSAWTGVANGGFNVTFDTGTVQHVTGINLTGITTMNGVASQINTQMTGGTCRWNANYDRFEFTSSTTGTTSNVSFLSTNTTSTPTPTDLSKAPVVPAPPGVIIPGLACSGTADGAYVAPGQAIETALTAATLIDQLYSSKWYALVCPSALPADHSSLALFAESADPPHYYGLTTSDPNALLSPQQSTADIGYTLHQLGCNKSACMFSTTNKYAVMSYLARILTTQWTGQNTTITLMYKQAPLVMPDNINTMQANNLQTKCYDVLTNYANGAHLIEYGTSASGEFTDTIIGADSLALDLQGNLFNVLYTSPTKVPQTDPGMQLLLNAASATCAQYAGNGWLGAGTWNAQGFGTLKTGDLLPLGYYVYAPSMLTQSAGARAARKAPLITIAAKCAGAIHTADVLVYVNQ